MYRNDELVNLKGADIQWDQVSDTGHGYFSITLVYRKTNQTDEKKGTTRSSMPSFFVVISVVLVTFIHTTFLLTSF
jgi:hypothetical protein